MQYRCTDRSRWRKEEWLVNFKNETHNHPTEIEPFGGAATCLGGAIRDPLSGRTYVYQAMRVTGAADPTVSVKDTLKGKLPQKKLVREQHMDTALMVTRSDLQPEQSKRIYHPNYVAKRMEIGAVSGQHQDVQYQRNFRSGRSSLSFSADVPDVTDAVEQPDLPKYIQKSLSRHVEQKYRKVMHLQKERSRDYSEEKKSAS